MSETMKTHGNEKAEHRLHEAAGTGANAIDNRSGLLPRTMAHLAFVLLLVSMAACAPVISEGVRKEVAPALTLREVARDADLYRGKVVLWSGAILETQNTRDGTLVKILQRPTDYEGRPRNVDESEGRFLARVDRYLDPAIYAAGRAVTVAGEIQGTKVEPLGEMDYTYPLLSVRELHLWPSETERRRYYDYPSYYWYGPPWWWHRYW